MSEPANSTDLHDGTAINKSSDQESKIMGYIKLIQLLNSGSTQSLQKHLTYMHKIQCDKILLQFFNLHATCGQTNEEKIYLNQKINIKNLKAIKLLHGLYTGHIVKSVLNYPLLKCYQKFGTLKIFLKRYIKRYHLGELYAIWADLLLIDPSLAQIVFDITRKHKMFFPEVLFFRGGSMIWYLLNKHIQYKHDSVEKYNPKLYNLCKKWSYETVVHPKIRDFIYRNVNKIKFTTVLTEDIYTILGVKSCINLITQSNANVWWDSVKTGSVLNHRIIFKLSTLCNFFENFEYSNGKLYLRHDFNVVFNYSNFNIFSHIRLNTSMPRNIVTVYESAKEKFIALVHRVTRISKDVVQYVIFKALYTIDEH